MSVLSRYTCTHVVPCICDLRSRPEPERAPIFMRANLTRLLPKIDHEAAMVMALRRFFYRPRVNPWKSLRGPR